MNFKRYVESSDTWVDTPHYIHNTSTDTLTTLPAVLYPNAATATVGLKGQAVQSSVPSPTSPVMPQGTGERTGNLFDTSILANNKSLNSSGVVIDSAGRTATITPIDVSNYTSVILSYTSNSVSFMFATFNGTTLVERTAAKSSGATIDVTNCDTLYISFYKASSITTDDVTEIMLNSGSTPLPYEPYGIKIPILSAGQTTPIYLGEVQSTRRIKKWVLDGTEDWLKGNYPPTGGYQFFASKPSDIANNPDWLTTHFKKGNGLNGSAFGSYLSLYPEASILPENASVNHFKAWLAAQYAAGTPVCVWYVLATPQTAVVNEPLMRIGDYADTVSNISIPVTAGGDTLSVDTTVQPSEVTVNYKGWHPVQNVHERDNGAWT